MSFSIGLIEVQALGHAITVADEMLKAADVKFIATERKLGGRLVTLVVKGNVSAVNAAIETGRNLAESLGCLKAAEVIARPHPEIFKFLHIDEEEKPVSKEEAKVEEKKVEEKTTKTTTTKKPATKKATGSKTSSKAGAKKPASDKKTSTRGQKKTTK